MAVAAMTPFAVIVFRTLHPPGNLEAPLPPLHVTSLFKLIRGIVRGTDSPAHSLRATHEKICPKY
jgi:hypothetical protein